MDSLDQIRRAAARDHALLRPPGKVTRIPPTPVHVRVITGYAIAVTQTHVLVEWEAYGEYHVRWEEKWQVKKV